MKGTLLHFITDEAGATAIEYGLIAALVSIAAIAAMSAVGGALQDMFVSVADILSCSTGGATSTGAACPP
jgi:pilus assembly protein Flp/PilA